MLKKSLNLKLVPLEQVIPKPRRVSKQLITAFLYLIASNSVAFADSFSCGEWSNSSLQHKGTVSIEMDKSTLIWSNGVNSYRANAIQNETPQLAYSDRASIYMIYGVFSVNDQLYNTGYLRIRRIFYVEEVLKVSQIECQ